jgi:hypothetical protein
MQPTPAWTAPPGVTRHDGAALTPDVDFFTGPPPGIGTIITADSTLTTTAAPLSTLTRFVRATFVGEIIAASIGLGFRWRAMEVSLTVLIAIAVIVAALAYLAMGSCHHCSFVGDRGLAEFTLKGARTNAPAAKVLRFQDAAHLYTSQTRRFKNGSYRGTTYRYQWTQRETTDDSGSYSISGSYYSPGGEPEATDRWHFANAAEAAWTAHLLKFANQDLKQKGFLEFPMVGNPQIVRVGKGFLEFVTPQGEAQRAMVADIREAKLHSGQFQFKHQDARWWSGKGKYRFTYGSMPNARLFLMCLRQLAGVTWQ